MIIAGTDKASMSPSSRPIFLILDILVISVSSNIQSFWRQNEHTRTVNQHVEWGDWIVHISYSSLHISS
jgi:hypothetical protein